MFGFGKTSPQTDITYQRIHLNGLDMLKTAGIDDPKSEILHLTKLEPTNTDEKIDAIAEVIADAHFDTLSNNAILTAGGYANKESLKEALLSIDITHWKNNLEAMLARGAFVYTALDKQEIVGVIVLIQLAEKIPTENLPKAGPTGEVPFPDPSDLEAVKVYAQSETKDKEFMHQLRCNVNSLLDHRDAGKVWELCGFGVKEKYRRRGIGRALVKYALSQVPGGDRVIIHAETRVEAMYRRMGFRYAPSGSGTVYSITLKPEWGGTQRPLVFPMMILQKEADKTSKR
ncbi:hypothetical protein F5B22DRAFT_645336 [Xylaria bambusicola]|uniref:uncharacterized protein n=1 Tax=Xylaria bambusicola TaxID=326684 RepID=UPI002008A2EC|nr:uncharacterized protein F5B22DRAFT_645336 [Xylaria bambusicola]KAI0518086.1 hypothetical protein F5B22DRAFT_645336 [Xylaria bambusicola]